MHLLNRVDMANRWPMCSEDARALMTAYNKAVARDPMVARSEFLNGIGVPPAKGN